MKNLNLGFLKYTRASFKTVTWTWDWKIDKKLDLYVVSNLTMLCPKCEKGVFTVSSMYADEYECIKCGHNRMIRGFSKPSSYQIKQEIFNKIREHNSAEMDYINTNEKN